MPLSSHQLEGYIARLEKSERIDALWLVTGTDELLIIETIDRIRKLARQMGYTDRQVLDLDGRTDYSLLTAAAYDVGMFDDKKIIECRFTTGKPGTAGAAALPKYVSRVPSGVVTIFSIATPDWQTTKTAWWQALSRACTVVNCAALSRHELPAWLSERLARHQQSASTDALEFFADLVEGNLFAANQEVEKLSLLYPQGELTREMIQAAVSNCSRFEIENLVRSIELGEADRVSRIVDALQGQNEALPLILMMLTQEIRSILRVRSALDRGVSPKSATYGVMGDSTGLTRAAKRLSLKKLQSALCVCGDIDRLSKGLPVNSRDSDPWIELKSVSIFLAR